MRQKGIQLNADRIDYDLNTKIVYARSRFDSTEMKYYPLTLREGTEVIEGSRLVYNIDEQRGKIARSKTQVEQAYYSSDVLRKEEKDEFLVHDGRYTTCELEEPHFHFSSSQMKVINDDRVIAKPVVLYIETVPVFALPYMVFSIKKDRHSGFTPIQVGNFERGQRFVNNLGYFWALSDYWDLRTTLNVSERIGLTFNAGARYAVRYKLSGSINGSWSRETTFSGVQRGRRNRGQLTFSHNHQVDPTITIAGSGTFVSDRTYFTETSTNIDERLNRQLRSQFSGSKRWESAALSVAVDQTKDIDRDSHSERLPTIRFSRPSRPLFGSPTDAASRRWYHEIYASYDNSFTNFQSKSLLLGLPTRRKYATLNQNASLRAPLKVAGAVTVSPSLNLTDSWYYLPVSDQAISTGLATNSLHSRQTWSSSVSLSTNLYGTVAPNILAITGLRHIMSPSASFTYRPDIKRNEDYARFTGVGGVGGRSKNVSFGLSNQFQMKYQRGDREVKANLLNLDFSASYDFVRAQRRWSDLQTSLRIPTVPRVTMQINMTHDLYNPADGSLRWWSPYLRNVSITSAYSGGLRVPVGRRPSDDHTPNGFYAAGDLKQLNYGFSYSYSESRTDGRTTSITHWVRFSLSFAPTANWNISYGQNYDIRRKESTSKEILVTRNLHCWEGQFRWIPDGSLAGYYFRINVKQLPVIKLEKSESGIRDALLGGIGAFPF